VREKTTPLGVAGRVLSFAKDDLGSGGVSTSIDGTRRGCSASVVVNSYATEIVTEALFHEIAR
jgi:hypothetical protein